MVTLALTLFTLATLAVATWACVLYRLSAASVREPHGGVWVPPAAVGASSVESSSRPFTSDASA